MSQDTIQNLLTAMFESINDTLTNGLAQSFAGMQEAITNITLGINSWRIIKLDVPANFLQCDGWTPIEDVLPDYKNMQDQSFQEICDISHYDKEIYSHLISLINNAKLTYNPNIQNGAPLVPVYKLTAPGNMDEWLCVPVQINMQIPDKPSIAYIIQKVDTNLNFIDETKPFVEFLLKN